jgi:PEP-CTERM motif
MFDEYGTGFIRLNDVNNAPWVAWNGSLQNDPTWSGHQSLIWVGNQRYDFSGHPYLDFVVYDSTGTVSDMVRIWYSSDPSQTDRFILYSNDTGGGAAADTGLPPVNTWCVAGTATEDANGIYDFRGWGSEWIGYSEGHVSIPVPEPTTMLLLGLGLVGLGGIRRKFKK